MKLSRVVKYFNNTPFYDAYTDEHLGMGQLDVYDDSKRDGLTAQRRVFEVDVGTKMADRGVIQFMNERWLVGVREMDIFRGKVHREKYVLHQAEELINYHSIKELLNDEEGVKAYAARVWAKTSAQVEISSEKFNQMQIFTSRSESVGIGDIFSFTNKQYIVTEVYPATAGHQAAISEELEPDSLEVGAITAQKFNPITDTYETTDSPIKLLRLRWQSNFDYLSLGSQLFERGDMQAAMLTELDAGTEIVLLDGKWVVQEVVQKRGVFYHHLRRR